MKQYKIEIDFSLNSPCVTILVHKEETMTEGGLYIPDTAQEKPKQGVVIAVGKGKYENGVLIAMTVQVGDRVLYGRFSGSEATIDGEDVLVCAETEVYAILIETE